MLLGDAGERHEFTAAGVDEQDIDPPGLLAHDPIQPVEVCQVRDIALDPARSVADLGHRPVEFGLSATGDEHACALAREPFGARETDAAGRACDHRDLVLAGIGEKVLIQQLRELAAAGVFTRHDHQRVPPMVDYTMTPFGMTLVRALMPLCEWGTEHRARVGEIMGALSPGLDEAASDPAGFRCSTSLR